MGFPAYVRQNQPIDRWLIDLVKLRWPHGEVTPFHLRIPTWPYASQGMWPIRSPALNHWAQEHAIQDGIKRWSLYENWLVVSTPLKNITVESVINYYSQYMEKKNVTNHQPE